jgi:hypothetical protein
MYVLANIDMLLLGTIATGYIMSGVNIYAILCVLPYSRIQDINVLLSAYVIIVC